MPGQLGALAGEHERDAGPLRRRRRLRWPAPSAASGDHARSSAAASAVDVAVTASRWGSGPGRPGMVQARSPTVGAGAEQLRRSRWASSPGRRRRAPTGRARPAPCSAVRARDRAAGASSTMTWALVPLNPNALTAARRGRSPRGHGRSSTRAPRSASMPSRCAATARRSAGGAGSASCWRASTILMTPAMPAAASRCPMFVLTEPRSNGRSAGRDRASTRRRAPGPRSGRRARCPCRGPRRRRCRSARDRPRRAPAR